MSEKYDGAEKRADEKNVIYHHLFSFIVVNIVLIIANLLFAQEKLWFYGGIIFG